MISPEEFIPLAEKSGLIHALGEWAITAAARLIREAPPGPWSVSVNVSPWELIRPDYPERVERALRAEGVEPRRLMIEVTEGVMVHRIEDVAANMHRLRELGVRMSIDDFGTGYSSLDYLRRFPVDSLKIARAFVEELGTSREQDRLVAAILRLGSTMGLETVAEGIELEQQRDRLRALKCRYGQGFFYSRPVPAEELDSMLLSARVA
jgi:EAL domain-containing protein (putative c-di-GMP-specific phosphodiesterase class I)